jgi:hypothetical protein
MYIEHQSKQLLLLLSKTMQWRHLEASQNLLHAVADSAVCCVCLKIQEALSKYPPDVNPGT